MPDLTRVLRRLENRITNRIANLFRRGEVSNASAAGFVQFPGYDDDDRFDDVPVWEGFGIATRMPSDTEVLTVGLGGRSEEAVVIAADSHEHRPTDLEVGDLVLYAAKSGSDQAQVRCQADGTTLVGGDSTAATHEMVHGDDYNSALQTWMDLVKTAFNSIPVGGGPVVLDNSAAKTALDAALSTKVKTA